MHHHKLFSKTHGFLQILRIESQTPKSLYPISYFHYSKSTQTPDSKLNLALKEIEETQSLKLIEDEGEEGKESQIQRRLLSHSSSPSDSKVEIFHPWPEWVELMESLLKKDYFVGGAENGFHFSRGDMGLKESNRIRTGCLNFARDRFDLIRYFSRKDIRVIVGSGCPSLDRKVVNSGKRLRAHVGIDEGNVCSSCNLRGSCERAYVKAREDEGGRTVDVMRILLTYGLDPITGSVENEPCLNKTIKESVRRLLKEMTEFSTRELSSSPPKVPSKRIPFKPEYSNQHQLPKDQIDVPMKQGDWICPKCNFVNFARNIKCLRCEGVSQERLKNLREDRDHLPMKKGDWICDKCNFLNFAKNTRCLQCKEKPSMRQLGPGEWECVSCNYINFRRNMVCLKCDWKRPKASNSTDSFAQFRHESEDHHQSSRMTFVRNNNEVNSRHFLRSENQSRKEDTDFWSDDDSSSHGDYCEFEDFPILGGKSAVSRDPHERERWKDELSRRSKGVSGVRKRSDDSDLGPATFPRSFQFGDSDDDDEMEGWFRCETKIENREPCERV
ncbi:hypothetical protein MRB53_029971 [Persea americana]|uniref:Uncharacterized protein n=1 Tax=Persea americana TaxID=3435 RepID=A0ACC2KK91_PERAE|nr:hypothetical protein MRB53_029971 [Persea americana]